MINDELKKVLLSALRLEDWDFKETTKAFEVPGWDSLNHVNVVLAVERHYGVRFKGVEVLKLANVGDLQRLVEAKRARSFQSD